MRLLRPIERLLDALTDPARRERTMVWTLAGYCLVWWVYGVLAKASQDIHFDMGEMVAWSREAGIGTPKHPPFAAWLVRGWFTVFPLTDWAYYLFAMVLATFSLWVAWRVSARYLDGEKRVVGVVLLTFIPFFNFHALKFNANTVLIPLWAVATWWFLRSFETRRISWAVLAGLGAAAAMLGKYWSIFLLAGLGIAALTDPRRGAYFRSPAPWVTMLIGALALGPHVAWIVANNFAPFAYAAASHQSDLAEAAYAAAGFVLGAAGYIAAPVIMAALAARPSAAAIRDTLWPATPERRFVLIAFATPILLPVLVAIAMKVGIVSLWSMGAMTLLPVVLLSSPLLTVSRRAATILLAAAVVFPFVMTLLAPAIALWIHRQGLDNNAAHYRLLAGEIEKAWRGTTDKPLRFLGSQTNLVNGVVFYLPGKPATFDIMSPEVTPWADRARILRDGIAFVCVSDDFACNQTVANRAAHAFWSDVTVSRTYLGFSDPPVHYRIAIVPPK
jgi:4-amino-4-deoxy-L-arabinose transferase-like glycosyltransferase